MQVKTQTIAKTDCPGRFFEFLLYPGFVVGHGNAYVKLQDGQVRNNIDRAAPVNVPRVDGDAVSLAVQTIYGLYKIGYGSNGVTA